MWCFQNISNFSGKKKTREFVQSRWWSLLGVRVCGWIWLPVTCSLSNLWPTPWFTHTSWLIPTLFVLFFSDLNFFFYWSIVALQCHVSFCCIAKWISYMYACNSSLLSLSSTSPTPSNPSGSSQSTKLNSLANTAGSHSLFYTSVQFSCSVVSNSLWPHGLHMPGFPVRHQLPELAQTHVHPVGDAIQPSHPLLSPFPPAQNPSQHQSLFQWVNFSHEVAKVLEFQL